MSRFQMAADSTDSVLLGMLELSGGARQRHSSSDPSLGSESGRAASFLTLRTVHRPTVGDSASASRQWRRLALLGKGNDSDGPT